MDFLNYWDTRIDANERFFNDYPHIANFAFSECQELWDHMSADHATLLARHNALREAVEWERECDYLWEFGPVLSNIAIDELLWSMMSARAEVDRLIAEAGGDK